MNKLLIFVSIIHSCLCAETATNRQPPEEPVHIVVNVKNDNSNSLGYGQSAGATSNCLCTFEFGKKLKDCVLQLSDEQINEELKTYKNNRLKNLWGMLKKEEKKDILMALDEPMYKRMTYIDSSLPANKQEFVSYNKYGHHISTWSARAVAGVLATGTYILIKSRF